MQLSITPKNDIMFRHILEKGLSHMSYKQEFIHFMVRSGVLTFGDFITKSGRKTP